jgi:hypothetical protein
VSLKGTIAAAVIALLSIGTASAHRIDEYLQATLVSLQPQGFQASMRLIPGMLIAPSVIGEIDRNADGVFSENEQRDYAERVLGDLVIGSDGQRVMPRLLSWRFPSPAQMLAGLGEIQIDYAAELPAGGSHRMLTLINRHKSGASVYLTNAVVPEDPGIRITAQKRNESQSSYELDYEQITSPREPTICFFCLRCCFPLRSS